MSRVPVNALAATSPQVGVDAGLLAHAPTGAFEASTPWWTWWTADPVMTLPLVVLTALYLRGAVARRHPAGHRPRRTAAFLAGVAVLLLAHTSPIAPAGDVLLWVHMLQHVLIVVVAAPLIAAGAPLATVRAGLDGTSRHLLAVATRSTRRLRRRLGDPHPLALATGAYVSCLWVWHAPVAYDLAVRVPWVHVLEHASFAVTAVWFWSQVWATARRHQRHQAVATLCLGVVILQGGVLGALMSLAGTSLYGAYDGAFGLTALEDQHLAGALMWVPPGFVYAPIAVRRFVAWLREAERAAARRHDAPTR